MTITREVLSIEVFNQVEVTAMFNAVFRKLTALQHEFGYVSADDLIEAFTEQVKYNLNGMLVEAAEELIG